VELPALAQITGAVTVLSNSASSTLNLSRLTTISGGTLDDGGGTLNLSALTDADGSNIVVSGGASLTLPGLTSYTGGGELVTSTLQASGDGSLLSLPDLATLTASTAFDSSVQVGPSSGGDVELPVVTQITGPVRLTCEGGSLDIGGAMVSMPTSGTGATINVPQLPQGIGLNLGTSGTLIGATFNIAQGDSVALTSGTYAGGTFNTAQGATLDLTGGQTVTYSGTLTASGSGTVQLSSGTLAVGIGGVTFNFLDNLFQWTGGAINGAAGTLTNDGTVNLSGSNEKVIYNDTTLDNFGTIVQTGSGNLGLHSDNQAPTILMIQPGASYLIESDSGVDNPSGGETEIENAGTIEKTAGTGTSTILVNGTLSNTGTIEADSGTFSLSATVAQVSGNTLTAGTWDAEAGSTLVFPSGTDITTDQASITLDGAGATIAAISGLSSSSGSFSLASGASFSTTGNFSNTGSLTIGAGSTLTVNGNYSQGPAGSLTVGGRRRLVRQRIRPAQRRWQRDASRVRQRFDRQRFHPISRRQLPDRDLCQRDRGQQPFVQGCE